MEQHKCENCAYKSTQLGNVKRHRMAIHGIRTPTARRQPTLENRSQAGTHTGTTGGNSQWTQATCKYCQFKTTRKDSLEKHTKSKHGTEEHRCSNCNYKSKWKSSVQRHFKKVHREHVNVDKDVQYQANEAQDNKNFEKEQNDLHEQWKTWRQSKNVNMELSSEEQANGIALASEENEHNTSIYFSAQSEVEDN